MPIPSGMTKSGSATRKSLYCWETENANDPVYYAIAASYDPDLMGTAGEHTLEELPEALMWLMDDHIYAVCGSGTSKDYSRIKTEATAEEQFFDFPTLRTNGTIELNDGTQLHFVAHYVYMTFPLEGTVNVPSFWMAFTPSDSKKALDLMNEAADLPLTKAKLHE